MKSSKRSDQSSAKDDLLKRIIRALLLAFLIVFLIFGSFMAVMYFSYGSEMVISILNLALEVLLPIVLIVTLAMVPVLFSLLRAYRRGFTPLTRSFVEVMGSILLSLALSLSLGFAVFLLIRGADAELAVQAAVYGIKSFLEILPLMVPAIIAVPLATRYIDRGERVPYPSILLITLTMFILSRNLMAASLLQSDTLTIRLASLLMLSPVLITCTWVLVWEDLTLKFVRAERVTDREFLEFVEELRRKAGVDARVEVLSMREVEGRARVLGIRKVVLLVSKDLLGAGQFRRKVAKATIMHELMHVKNLDTLSHALATTAYRSMLAAGVCLLAMLFVVPELRYEAVLADWSQLHVLNPLVLFASERWCCRLREVHADLKVQEKETDLAEILRLITVPRKRRIGFPRPASRLEFLQEPYRAFIPSYTEGFVFSIAFLHLLFCTQYSVYYSQLSPLKYPLHALLLTLAGMVVICLVLMQLQLHELQELASEFELKPKLGYVFTPRAAAGALAGFLIFLLAGILPDILKAAFAL